MNTNVVTETRAIVHRTRGSAHGPITRLVSPGDLGEFLKPFVFLDLFGFTPAAGHKGFGMHPHSGIATLTYMVEGQVGYEDTTGKKGVLPAGGVEWMRAGNGVWHTGAPVSGSPVQGFQLWVALPASEENAPAESLYLSPEQLPQEGPARVLLGRYGAAQSADSRTRRHDLPGRHPQGRRAMALHTAPRPHRRLGRGQRRPAGCGRRIRRTDCDR
jgi:redox-sensitive bicupin YhaK (pirin superfamily)